MREPQRFHFVSSDRRVREDRRFVAGQGRFAADIALPEMKHVALVTSPHPAARIVAIDKAAALAMPGAHYVLDGSELAAASLPLTAELDAPNVPRRPLAVDVARYSGEWVAAVVADTRALAEDAAEHVRIDYQPLPYVLDAEAALAGGAPPVHAAHGSNVLLDRTFVWGDVERDFAASPHRLAFRVKWGRSSTVPLETFTVTASFDPWRDMLDVWASMQMPKFPDQIAVALRMPASSVRVHHDVDVGGSYEVKRGVKHAVLAGYLAKRLGMPIRLIEDRLENMRGGDAHGPERLFDVEIAFDASGVIRSMKMRALDNVGAYCGRSVLQLGKPIGAIVGPYRMRSVQYRAVAVTTNKTVQEAVRGFGQGPTNYAIERAVEEVAAKLSLDPIEVRRRNFIRAEEFPYTIPSGSTYDSGDYHAVVDKTLARCGYAALRAERERWRAQGLLAGIGIAACLEPSGGNASFEALLNPKSTTTTWMESCRVMVDTTGGVTATVHTNSSGQGHETLAATVVGEVHGDRSRSHARYTAQFALLAAGQQSGRQPHGDHARRRRLPCGAEAQGENDRDCRARSRNSRRSRSLPRRRCERPRGCNASSQLAGPRQHRAPQLSSVAAGNGTGTCMQPHHAGADRRRAADARRAGADVSVLCLRISSSAAHHRSRARQAGDPPLRRRP